MNRLGNIRLPPLSAAVNVAGQTFRQMIPERAPGHERVHFAQVNHTTHGGTTDEHHEMTNIKQTTNPFLQENFEAEDSFNEDLKTRMSSVDFSEGSDFVEGKSDVKISEYQAAWNVTNAIQGMFIVSLPFAVLRGGYWAIVAMVGIAYICCYTGKILVECLYEFDVQTGRQVRVRDSYVSIAKACFGKKYGARIVNIAQIIELLMTCILYVVVCGDLMIGTFPDGAIDTRSWMMLVGIFLLPLAFLKTLQSVSLLSFWCTMSHILINAIILGYCLLYIGDWGWGKVKWSLDLENFPISLGVIVFSYTSQIFLPTLEGNMEDPSKFQWMLDWSHVWAAVFKALFGYLCFLTFQNDTQQVITNNLPSAGFKGLVNICLVIKALLSYPLPYYAACELLERAFFRGKPKTPFPTIWALDGELKVWGLACRVGVVVFTILMACFIPHFAILMGFIGSFTGTMLSFIWPCYFHLKLKREGMDSRTVAFDYFIISLGMLFGFVGIYDSGRALINAFQIGLPF
ncbi:vesicular inhibitory amino acid transporter [Tribolium castaneum]|uniref:Vesicular inhibitory amino acid transporter n=1 Tax=Tribolium castaneum TaxID=7070 RepID=D6WTB1_TRICA|nr:PREDICTED: vesicular inhibitory amino acid transporter [Tribolium castaneum]EFA06315.1 Vesicular inhibitory amino acid transporter-like Protein [Tribolium castaneum]|eukprot:XP_008195419.1 PREDICTED: vesicular inhibitory amino acid transporter [Tribolium castaneum]